jgi:cytoskeletal protein CcmA (bactofilin family)
MIFKLPIISALALGAVTALAEPAQSDPTAFPFVQMDEFRLPAGHSLPDEQWILARNITIDGDAQDDLFLFAGASRQGLTTTGSGLVAINGALNSDLWAAGQTLEINGPVEHHLRAASHLLRLNSRVGGNVLAAATTASLDTNAIVGGSVRIMADYFILRGTIDGNLRITARKVDIDGEVQGSVFIRADEIGILSNARIHGDLTCETMGPVNPDSRAVIDGARITRQPLGQESFSIFKAASTLIAFIGALLAGLFFFLVAPRTVARSTLWMENYPWRTLLVGMAALLTAPLLILFMFATILGIPMALVMGGLYGLALYLGRFIAALSVARLLTGRRSRQPIPLPTPHLMVLGLALFYLSSFLPAFLADAIWFWFTVTGMGGLIMGMRGALPLPAGSTPPPLPGTETPPPPYHRS